MLYINKLQVIHTPKYCKSNEILSRILCSKMPQLELKLRVMYRTPSYHYTEHSYIHAHMHNIHVHVGVHVHITVWTCETVTSILFYTLRITLSYSKQLKLAELQLYICTHASCGFQRYMYISVMQSEHDFGRILEYSIRFKLCNKM